jgi:predicted ester cyclase
MLATIGKPSTSPQPRVDPRVVTVAKRWPGGEAAGMTTTTHTNEAIALRSLELISNGDSGPAVDEIVHPDAVNHRAPEGAPDGPDSFRNVVRWLHAAFADLSITPLDVITSADKVVARTRFKGLHVGPFQGIPPTNRTIAFEQIHIWRIADGLIAEHWACMDEVTALRQMGAELH